MVFSKTVFGGLENVNGSWISRICVTFEESSVTLLYCNVIMRGQISLRAYLKPSSKCALHFSNLIIYSDCALTDTPDEMT